MKKLLFFAAFCTMAISGCLKNDDSTSCVTKTLEQDLPSMTKFASDSSINTTQDNSGILYEIIDPGDANHPTLSSKIVAAYRGRNMSGQLFDSGKFPEAYSLSQLIKGWQIILPKIGVGGKMKMIIPSSLGYGCYAPTTLVLNQPLYFYVELVSIQ